MPCGNREAIQDGLARYPGGGYDGAGIVPQRQVHDETFQRLRVEIAQIGIVAQEVPAEDAPIRRHSRVGIGTPGSGISPPDHHTLGKHETVVHAAGGLNIKRGQTGAWEDHSAVRLVDTSGDSDLISRLGDFQCVLEAEVGIFPGGPGIIARTGCS